MQEILLTDEKNFVDERNENFSPSPQRISISNTLQLPYKQDQGNLDQRARLDYLVKSILLSNPSHVYVCIISQCSSKFQIPNKFGLFSL